MSDKAHHFANPRFPTTSWTLLEVVQKGSPETKMEALDVLCTHYQSPVYQFIRKSGWSHHDAQDLMQSFFAKLLRLDAFEDVEREKGRLRTYLSKSLSRFLINHHHSHAARKKHEDSAGLASDLDRACAHSGAATNESPETLFERAWCRQLLLTVLARLEEEYTSDGRKAAFDALRPVILSGGSLRGHDTRSIAAALNVNETALRATLHRMLRLYRTLLEDEVRKTVVSEEDVEDEIHHLQNVVFSPLQN